MWQASPWHKALQAKQCVVKTAKQCVVKTDYLLYKFGLLHLLELTKTSTKAVKVTSNTLFICIEFGFDQCSTTCNYCSLYSITLNDLIICFLLNAKSVQFSVSQNRLAVFSYFEVFIYLFLTLILLTLGVYLENIKLLRLWR